jgi:hypothetical protein
VSDTTIDDWNTKAGKIKILGLKALRREMK